MTKLFAFVYPQTLINTGQDIMIQLLFILMLLLPTTANSLSVPLEVKERLGVSRVNAPVTYGVPFAREDNIFSTQHLSILGKEAQFRVLSRYDGTPDDTTRPIRSVLVDFQDSINGDEFRVHTLVDMESSHTTGVMLASEKTDFIEINTGVLTLQISKTSGNIFDSAVIDTTPLLASPQDDTFTVVQQCITYYSTPTSAEIEENGSLRCVIKVQGVFKDKNGDTLYPELTRTNVQPDSPLRYTIRYFAYKNKGYVKLQVTLRNENYGWSYQQTDPVHNIKISQAYLKTTVNKLSSPRTVAFEGYSDDAGENVYQLQQRETSSGLTPSYNWAYTIDKNDNLVVTGSKYEGYADVRDSSKGLMVADRWFWQNHPIGVTISGNELRMDLWPLTENTHRILGGMWKTHELLYYFHGVDTDFTDELAHLRQRLIARPSDEYYARTNFVWGMAPKNIEDDYTFPAGEKMQTVLDSLSAMHRAQFDENYSTSLYYPNTVQSLRKGRKVKLSANPDTFATGYGWLEFGAMARGAGYGYHNQHYDWSYLALSGFLRFTDYSMLDVAEELLMHKADIITLHDPDAKKGSGLAYQYHGGQRYELDSLLSYHSDFPISGNAAPRKASHLWTKGLTLQYLLTGEKHYFDAVKQSYDHILRVQKTAPMLTSETRNQFRGIDALCNGYQLTGDKEYLDSAWFLFHEGLLPAEGGHCIKPGDVRTCVGDGRSGYIIGGDVSHHDVGIGGDAFMAEPLIKLYFTLVGAEETAKASELKAFLIRWALWVRNDLITSDPDDGTYRKNKTEYSPYLGYFAWSKGKGYYKDNNIKYSVVLQPYAELFAFIYTETSPENPAWLNLARTIEKDSIFYTANQDGFVPTQYTVRGGIPGIAIDNLLSSGSFKGPKTITKAMYFARVEWLLSRNWGK